MREIRIRELSLEEAREKLERELNEAFLNGELRVSVLHGIGTGRLKQLTREVARSYEFVKIPPETVVYRNPGTTLLDLDPPDRSTLKKWMG